MSVRLRTRRLAASFVAMGLVFSAAGEGASRAGRTQEDAPPERSLRSIERAKLVCTSTAGGRDVTLFANGTIRLRETDGEDRRLWLEEIGQAEADAYVARLAEPARRDTDPDYAAVAGPWLESCRLTLDLPGREIESYGFNDFASLSLDLQNTVNVVLELEERVDRSAPPEGAERLPAGYRARTGDVLIRAGDGEPFRVMGLTADELGVELLGLSQPVTLYLPHDQIPRQFVALRRR